MAESNKETTGVVVSTFMLASLLVYISANVILLVVQVKHSNWLSSPNPETGEIRLCGPYLDNTN